MAGPEDEITIVSGLPRSGTSLMMQMLAAGGVPLLVDSQRAPDADNPRGYFEYEPVKRSYRDLSWLEAATGKAVKVVVPLLTLLPSDRQFRVLLLRRQMGEVLESQRLMLERLGAQQAPPEDERLAQVLHAQWEESAAWCGRHARSQVVDHAELLRDASSVAAQVSEFLGGSLDQVAMSACPEPALHRQRR